jgi:hypothetical protein
MKEVVERESVATGITMEVEELQRQNQDSFRVRSMFSRAAWRGGAISLNHPFTPPDPRVVPLHIASFPYARRC